MQVQPAAYTLPTSALGRWLLGQGKPVPSEIQARIIAGLFTSVTSLVVGALANTVVNLTAFLRHPGPVFGSLLAVDVLLLVARLLLLLWSNRIARRGGRTPTDLFAISSVTWAALVGIGTALCVWTMDPVLILLSPTCMMGLLSGLVVRNSHAPRLALTQVVLCDLPFKFVLPFCGEPWLLVSCAQFPLFLLGILSAIVRLNRNNIALMMAERESEMRATRDALTGLWNRPGLMLALTRNLRRRASTAEPFALFYLDLDGFKLVNDRFGHAAGDDLLRHVASRVVETVPENCILARLGGDEFVMLAPDCDIASATSIGRSVVHALTQPFDLGQDVPARIGVSIGIAYARPEMTAEQLLAEADAALYKAKNAGKGRCVFAQLPQEVAAALS